MCAPMHLESCDCSCSCGCQGVLSVDDEIAMLEATKVRLQVQINQIQRRIDGLKGRT